jgi:FAD/FMN-containing dehydrogenase
LKQEVQGRMLKVESPLDVCQIKPQGETCTEVFNKLENPYYISNQPALTQTTGWADAWTSAPSVYAVEASKTADVVAAVNFARNHNLRLVVKGGAHSYQGRSCSEDSLLIWTRRMNDVSLYDKFVPQGCSDTLSSQPAVSIGAGAIWMDAYDAVTTKAGRYVQGGGCTTVGVAGLIQSGGFGSFSKNYGLAASGLLEAEVVTADGEVRIANACTNPDLFWALKGGGGGSFGVVTRLTLKTRELPNFFGGVFGKINAKSDTAFRRLITQILRFYQDQLFNRHWGEQIRFGTDNSVSIQMVFQGLSQQQAQAAWQPFLDWVANERDITWVQPLQVAALPARHFWNAEFLEQHVPQLIVRDDRPDANPGDFFWAGDQEQTGQYLHAYRSAWLPASLLGKGQQSTLVDALVACCRHWSVSLHFNKGLAGAPASELMEAKNTAMNPAVLDAFALAIVAGGAEESQVCPGILGHEPNPVEARRRAGAINTAMDKLLEIVPQPGSYISESNYFEEDWQRSFWGSNYSRLASIKEKFDPEGLFFIHHGVGSEEWSEDGFKRIKNT